MKEFFLLLLLSTTAFAQSPAVPQQEVISRPVTDPTTLTTQAQEKATAAQRELFEAKIHSINEELDRQKKTLDVTDERLIRRLNEVPLVIEKQVINLQRLMEEKFKGVDQQFQGRDVALAAALLAQKTSVDEQNKANAASSAKQEGAITKQIDGIQSIITANSKGTEDRIDSVKTLLAVAVKSNDDKIGDLRNTINDLRSAVAQTSSRSAGQSDLWAYMVAGAGLLIAFLGFIIPKLMAPSTPHYQSYPYYPGYAQPPQPQVSVPLVAVPPNGRGA